MTPAELREDVAVELEALEATVQELVALQLDVADRTPTMDTDEPMLNGI